MTAPPAVNQTVAGRAPGVHQNTVEIYELGLRRHVVPAFGTRQVRAITPDQLVAWIRGLRSAGNAPDSVVNFWRPLNLVLGHAVRHGVIAASPAYRLTSAERPGPGPSRQRLLSRAEMERLLVAAASRYRTAIACGLFSGLRLSEPLGLTWGDVDLGERALKVRHQLSPQGERVAHTKRRDHVTGLRAPVRRGGPCPGCAGRP